MNKMTKKNKPETLYIQDLLLVHGNKFRPRVLREYFEEDGVYYKNSFKPTKYMQLVGKPERFPKIITDFIFHLVNYKDDNLNYFINNLAYFFKYLKKSQVAIALIGEQGAGKGILFENIISELFGREYCITINNDSINSSYKAKIIKDKLYYSFDEVKLKTSEKNDSFIKAIITNPSISLEEKNVTMNKEIELFGQCIFSSNNMDALKIEESDRRFTVIKTGVNISKTNFLNYGSYDALIEGIRVDLEDFAKYLKNYDVDIELANTVLDTVEKRVILNSQKNNLAEFHTAIINSNIDYFKDIWILDSELYTNLKFDFMENKINRANIAKAYNLLFSKKMSSKEILKELRTIPPYEIFSEKNNLKHSGNNHYFSLSR